MISIVNLVAQLLLASSALAAAGVDGPRPCKRGACNADNCLRAVRATALARPADASADCAAFLRKTVIPCPATTTITPTSTGPAFTSTVTQITQVVSTETQIVPFTSVVTTIEDVVGQTATSLISVGETATVTVTLQARVEVSAPAENGQSSAGSTCSTLERASAIPAYASACSGEVRYSSACSCYGVSATTITASQATTTFTASPALITPTITVTAQQTQLSVQTQVQSSLVPQTFETTITSIVATALVTEVSKATVTQTVTPSQCNTFAPFATNGAFAGHALQRNPSGLFGFSPDMSNPQLLVTQSDGYLHMPEHPNRVIMQRNPTKSVLLFLDPSENPGWTPLKCRVGDPLNQSGIFPLYCDGGSFFTCPNENTLYIGSSIAATCTIADLGVFKACN